jgi:Na+/H+-translocating membrane pyrophosphatase
VYFSFGSVTIAIGSRIFNSVYSKGADFAMNTMGLAKDRLQEDSRHPALIARALGEIVNRSLSAVLDSVGYLSAGVTVPMFISACNIMGVDQKGEITFQYTLKNCYLPILSFLFSLFYNLLLNVITSLISPSTA